jgi:hypothetical protein
MPHADRQQSPVHLLNIICVALFSSMNNQLGIVQDVATGKEQTNVEIDLNETSPLPCKSQPHDMDARTLKISCDRPNRFIRLRMTMTEAPVPRIPAIQTNESMPMDLGSLSYLRGTERFVAWSTEH